MNRLLKCLFLLLTLCCHLLPAAHGQQMGWRTARRFGGSDQQAGQPNYVAGMVMDGQGNQYVAGSFVGVTDFGGIPYVSAGYHDGYLAKYNSAGVLQWVRRLAGPSDEFIYGLCLAPAGGCYVVGNYGGGASLDGAGALPDTALVVARYDDAGNLTWHDIAARHSPGSGLVTAYRVAADVAGRCYVIGEMGPVTRTFGSITVTMPANAQSTRNPVVWCYNAAGVVQWAKATTITNMDALITGIVSTNNGCVVTGRYSGEAGSVLGYPTDTTAGRGLGINYDGFVVALDSVGTTTWGSLIKNYVGRMLLAPPVLDGVTHWVPHLGYGTSAELPERCRG